MAKRIKMKKEKYQQCVCCLNCYQSYFFEEKACKKIWRNIIMAKEKVYLNVGTNKKHQYNNVLLFISKSGSR